MRPREPIGSGAVESCIRRVVNLRMKSPSTFWDEENAEGIMHLRALYKSGRWDETFMQALDCRAIPGAAYGARKWECDLRCRTRCEIHQWHSWGRVYHQSKSQSPATQPQREIQVSLSPQSGNGYSRHPEFTWHPPYVLHVALVFHLWLSYPSQS